MIKFIDKPNLPESKVSKAICGTDDTLICDFFKSKGILIFKNKPNPFVDSAVSTHADMAVLHLGGNKVLIDKNQTALADRLISEGFTVFKSEKAVKGEYPGDISLNFTLTEKFAAGSLKHADSELLRNINGKILLNVKQGYCKCSVLVVNENAIITDDDGIYRTFRENGIDSLIVSKGDIHLEGHEYGFIGGASGKISKNEVVFFGDISSHWDCDRITAFLSKHGCGYVCTDKNHLRDIGGIIPLYEK